MPAPPPFRPSSPAVVRPVASWAGAGRGRVVQGIFQSRPFSFAAVNPGPDNSKAVQRKPVIQCRPGVDAFQVDLRPKSGGWTLPRDVQAKMEAALGANFSDVRVHVGPEASAIGAIAFTWGSDVHFAPGQYNPHTPHGQFLLGHELAHVVQQRTGRVANPFGSGVAVVQDHALEAEADRLGRAAAMSKMLPADSLALQPKVSESPVLSSAPSIQRRPLFCSASHQAVAPAYRAFGKQPRHVLQTAPDPTRTVASARMQHAFRALQRETTPGRMAAGVRTIQRAPSPELKALDELEEFLFNQVAPWATQARLHALMHEPTEGPKLEQFDPDRPPKPAVFSRRPDAPPSDLGWENLPFLPTTVDEKEKRHIVHRDVPEIENYLGKPCVRVYHTGTLKEEAGVRKGPKITQSKGGAVDIPFQKAPKMARAVEDQGTAPKVSVGAKNKEKVFFLSGGTPLRQLGWAAKKVQEKPGSYAAVSSFLVALDTYNEITGKAVPEQMKGYAEVRNVDFTGAPNQYGVSGKAFELLRNSAQPGSLVTYVEDPTILEGSSWGKVEPISVLRQRLHVPPGIGLTGLSGRENIIVDEKTAKFSQKVTYVPNEPWPWLPSPAPKNFGVTADEYANALGLWLGKERGSGLLNKASLHAKDFEQHRGDTLRAFLARFGYDLPENWNVIRDLAKIRYSESAETFEKNLGIYLSTDSRALDAASRMCNGLWRLFLDQKRKESDIERFGRKKDGSAGSVGTDRFQLSLVPAQGNLREKLTWVLAAIRSGIAAELLAHEGHLQTTGGAIPHFHDPKKERLEDERKSVEREADRLTKQKPIEVQHPPLSLAEEKVAVTGEGKLEWVTGGRSINYAMKTSYQLQAEKELRLVAAGPSGAGFAMLYVANGLGVNLLEARLALLTWMLTVGDHTFDEIMEGCAVWGQMNGKPELAYPNRSSVKRYRSIAPLTEYELRRFVCENDEFPDEALTERMLNEMSSGTNQRFF